MIPRAVAVALLLLACAAPAHGAGAPIMPLDQVRAGMDCTAASVVKGTAISTFAAHVDDVLGAGDIRHARILVTVSGAAIDATGVGPGFSGSPVSCPGADGTALVVGAISETIGAYGGKDRPGDADPGDPRGVRRSTAGRAAHVGAGPCAAARGSPDRRAAEHLRSLARDRSGRRARRAPGRAHGHQHPGEPAPGSRRDTAAARVGDVRRTVQRRRPGGRDRHGRLRRRRHGVGLRPPARRRRPARAVPVGRLRLRRREQPARHPGRGDVQAGRADGRRRHAAPGRDQRRRRTPRRAAAPLPGDVRHARPRHREDRRPARRRSPTSARSGCRPAPRHCRPSRRRRRPRRSTTPSTGRPSTRPTSCA